MMHPSRIVLLGVTALFASQGYSEDLLEGLLVPMQATDYGAESLAPTQHPHTVAPYQAFLVADGEVRAHRDGQLATSNPNESVAIARNQAQLVLQNVTLLKEGISTQREESSFRGLNSALLSEDSTVQLANASITTNAEGANAVVSRGPRSHITVEHTVIKTTEDYSHGLHATYNGTIAARDLVIETQGEHCAALSTDRGEGMVELVTGNLTTYGAHSPLFYSTGLIKAAEISGFSNGSEIAVIDGKNALLLEHCELTARVKHGIMIYQSFPDDPLSGGTASFSARECRLNNLSDGYLFYITNTQAQIYLERTQLQNNTDHLIRACADLYGHDGRNGGHLTLNTREQRLTGEIEADALSTLTINLGERSTFVGLINQYRTAQAVHVNLAADANWELTGPSYLNSIADADPSFSNIRSNGFTITYKSAECPQLHGQSFNLPGGGRLEPEFEN